MVNHELLSGYSKDELIELIEILSKNFLAIDGVWFQSVERKLGMDEAMYHDIEAWKRFTVIDARRIKEFLGLEEHPGLEGLKLALQHRFNANLNMCDYVIEGNTLTYSVVECRVQKARKRKGMELHPCKPAGAAEYSGFARTIDDRISCECLSCYPDITDEGCSCKWRFTLHEYGFYGWEKALVKPLSDELSGICDLRDLYDALSEIWCADTCAPRMRNNWTSENKTLGQCSVTAFLVQDIFGGEVYGVLRPGGNYHCYNVIEGHIFDLTSEQFGEEAKELVYDCEPVQLREVHFAKEEKRLRYEMLKKALFEKYGR